MPWYVYVIGASIVWGLHYNIVSKILKWGVSPFTIYWLPTIVCLLVLPFVHKSLIADFQHAMSGPPIVRYGVFIYTFTSILASLLLFTGFKYAPSPTVATILEMTYPLFIALFGYLLFKENQLDMATLIGGALIFCGVGIIIYFK